MQCVFILLLVVALATEELTLEGQFSAFKSQFQRVYASEAEEKYRKGVFQRNLEIIKEHNAKQDSYTLGVTPFSDLTLEEFQEKFVFNRVLMQQHASSGKASTPSTARTLSGIPTSVDWREKHAVSSVKNQQSCGSCWAFSTVGSIEGAYAIKTGQLLSFSPQYLVDCDHGDSGCQGGLMTNAFEFVMSNGVPTEESYPYRGVEGSCKKVELVTSILGYYDVPESNEYEMLKAISKNPVAVAIEADTAVFQNYKSGVIKSSGCGTNLNHGVLAVGYDRTDESGYYIVKNSWGSAWGENGYVRLGLSGDGPGVCGIQLMASYPFIDL